MTKRGLGVLVLAAGALAAQARAQVPAGSEFRVNTYTPDAQIEPATAVAPGGRFLVVWQGGDPASQGDIQARLYDASGVPRGDEFRVNTSTTNVQAQPAVAADARGNFVVVWASAHPAGGNSDVFGQRLDALGTPVGGEFQVNTGSVILDQFTPSVATAPNGTFVVVWENNYQAGPNYRIVIAGRRFSAAAAPLGVEFTVNTYTAAGSLQTYPSVATDPVGRFIVTWDSASFTGTGQDGSNSGVFAQLFDASGARLGGEFRVNAFTTGSQRRSGAVFAPDGSFMVAWESPQDGSGTGIYGHRFDAVGTRLGAEFRVNTYTTNTQLDASIAADGLGNAVVSWESASQDGDSTGIYGQRLTALGAPRGAEFRVNTTISGSQNNPAVDVDPVGNVVVGWDGPQPAASTDVLAQRLGGLFPRALGVDAGGNSVLDPGETATVQPFWENLTGASLGFSSSLSSLSGPAGGSYTINDGGADYGSVSNGATQACTLDCFAVTIAAATRPVLHWDASAVEAINPAAQGQQKLWAVHVGGSFTDVASVNPFYRFVETLLHRGITSGCGGTSYCPASGTTRAQMAVFVLLAKEGAAYVPPACVTPPFPDVPVTSPFCPFVAELARRGVVGGCGGGNYCPGAPVTRAEMAVFVLRTLEPAFIPPSCVAGNEMFNDLPAGSLFCPWVEELVRRGVVVGCAPNTYCTAFPVLRDQMGVFICVPFGLTLYGP